MIHIQFIKFCIIGAAATIVSYLIFYVTLNFFGINYLVASSLGFCSGVLFGYSFNCKWTFSHNKNQYNALKYWSVYLISLLLSLIFLKIVVDYLGIQPEFANIVSIGLTTITNFVGTKFFVFKNDSKKHSLTQNQ